MKSKKRKTAGGSGVFGRGRVLMLTLCALFAALSIVLGKYLSIKTDLFRISFENLTVLMAGVFFGPVAGILTGACADLVGCVLVGYSINPIITLGAASIGGVSGLCSKLFGAVKGRVAPLFISVMLAHTVGSMIIKTFGLWVYYRQPFAILVWRVPLYVVIGALEFYIIYLLMKNRGVSDVIRRAVSDSRGRNTPDEEDKSANGAVIYANIGENTVKTANDGENIDENVETKGDGE